MGKLVVRLFARAGIEGFNPHDLRRTFSSLVRKHSGDEGLAMRLLRDQVPDLNSRYISVSDAELYEGLLNHSPLRQLQKKSHLLEGRGDTVEGRGEHGGGGGESNSH